MTKRERPAHICKRGLRNPLSVKLGRPQSVRGLSLFRLPLGSMSPKESPKLSRTVSTPKWQPGLTSRTEECRIAPLLQLPGSPLPPPVGPFQGIRSLRCSLVAYDPKEELTMNSLTRVIRAGSFALVIAVLSLTARASEWQRGDVFVAIGNGQYQVYRITNSGEITFYSLIETLTDGSGKPSGENGSGGNGYTTGCAFDSTGHLYTTNFSNANVYKFMVADPHAVSQIIPASEGARGSESIVFDGQGNFYVGHADGSHVVDKFSPTGACIQSFTVAPEDRGSDWIELSADGNTLYYTSEGTHIKSFNLMSGTQGPDLINLPSTAFALRLLPSNFAFAGYFLVADSTSVERVHI